MNSAPNRFDSIEPRAHRVRLLRAGRLLVWFATLAAFLGVVCCETFVPPNSWKQSWGPVVPHDNFSMECSTCHVADSWHEIRDDFTFDHEKETGHPLRGAHAETNCLLCHNDLGPVQAYVARGCGGCHVDPHRGNLGNACTECHGEEHWRPGGLIADHARTRFPLVGAHAITPCETCHERATLGEYRGTQPECEFCHQRDAARASPPHVINGWHYDCQRCHTPLAWTARGFDHSAFPLVDGHAGLDCTQCHASGQFTPLDPNCFACHQNDYVNAPNHVANGFSTNCLDCHNTVAWR